MLTLIISTIIGGLLIPFVLLGIKLIFNISTFSLKATFIPVRHLLEVILRWGKYLAIPLGLLMLMHPKEFSLANGALAEKLGLIILVIGAVYTLRACFRGFSQVAAVAAWCAVSLVGVHFYGEQKVINHISQFVGTDKTLDFKTTNIKFKQTSERKLTVLPFADPKKSILHASNCELDCLEEVSFISENENSSYSLDSSNLSVVDKLDETYKATINQGADLIGGKSNSIETLPSEAFFGKPYQAKSSTGSLLDQGKSLLSLLF
jgi:hypothetical protein